MPFYEIDGLRYYSFPSLESLPVIQAVFTRRGGRSPSPWSSLNVGGTVGDRPERVAANHRLILSALSRPPDSTFEVWQIHSAQVEIAEAPRPGFKRLPRADALLTDNPQVTLFMRFADCVPILLSDPARGVVGLVHAGWQGTVQKVVLAAVGAMVQRYGSRPDQIFAGIGPSIGPDHYEVGPDVIARVQEAFDDQSERLLPADNGKVSFDLWQANRLLLLSAGVERVEVAGICTGCHLDDWYSHRAEKGQTGRFGAAIAVRS